MVYSYWSGLYYIIPAIALIIYISYLAQRVRQKRGMKKRIGNAHIAIPIISAIITIAYFSYLGVGGNLTIILASISMVSSFLATYYYGLKRLFASLAFVAAAAVLTSYYLPYAYILQSFAIGIVLMLSYEKYIANRKSGRVKVVAETEKVRDAIQIAIGFAVLALILVSDIYYIYIFWLSLLAFSVIAFTAIFKDNSVSRELHKIEKPGREYGLGALLLVAGSILIISFVGDFRLKLFLLSVLLFADPIATIVGLTLDGPKLFYNKDKSVYGTLSFFLSGIVIGTPLVGLYSIPISAVLSLVESLKNLVDDNIEIALISIIIYLLYYL